MRSPSEKGICADEVFAYAVPELSERPFDGLPRVSYVPSGVSGRIRVCLELLMRALLRSA